MRDRDHDVELIRRSLEVAANGISLVSPGPLVGCVIAAADGQNVGEGSYSFDGVTHAEVIALDKAGDKAKGGTAYISLEPHDHQSRTPPCTDALINAGIKRVVCPIEDPNPLVSGRGFEKLRNAGIEVGTGILAGEATKLNEKFICWHQKQRPFVHLKMAMSLDGRISLNSSVSTALTGPETLSYVQSLRHEYDAILVGSNTAVVDNPNLTDRTEKPRRRPLMRIVLDNSLCLSTNSILAKTAGETPTLVFTNSRDSESKTRLRDLGVQIVESPMGGRDLNVVLQELKNRYVQSVLVEGGAEVAGSFCDERLVDKITFISAPIIIGGREAPNAIGGLGADSLADTLRLSDITVERYGDDIAITGYPAGRGQ